MANKRIDIMVLKLLIELHKSGQSNRQISKMTGIHRNTVNDYVRKIRSLGGGVEELSGMEESELADLFTGKTAPNKPERLKILLEYFPQVKKEVKRVGFTFHKMWQSYRSIHDDGYSYSQFMEYYHRWNETKDVTLKLHHKAGECMMVDYTGDKLEWVDRHTGQVHEVEVFVSCLPASQYTYVEASPSQKRDDFLKSMINCLNYFGGVPKVSIVDNLKSAVSKASKYEPVLNRSLRELGLHYGQVLNPTRPYSPQDKGMVERNVKLIYTEIFFEMRDETFYSLKELNDRIYELLEIFNNTKQLSQIKKTRKELFDEIEKPVLKPLPPQPYVIRTIKRAKVQKTCHVYLSEDKHYYSVPHKYVGHHVRIHYSDKIVEVYYDGHRIATHLRLRTPSGYTTKAFHLPEKHQRYLNWNPEYFIQLSTQIGPQCKQYITRLFAQDGYAQTKYKTAMGIIQLKRMYDKNRIEKACQIAILHPVSSYQRLKGILEKNLDLDKRLFDNEQAFNSHIPDHENIRGANYFSSN